MAGKKSAMFYGADVVIFENAKYLRDYMTEAETKLWERISKNKLGIRFKPQHPISNYIADFYCHQAKLIIEVDGAVHFNQNAIEQDALRTEDLEKFELKVIRFTNEQILKDIDFVIGEITAHI